MSNSLSVFFPCINEEENIKNTVEDAEKVLKKLQIKYEIIIIDDGSTDNTGQIADALALANPHIRVIHHAKNFGYGEALKSGFYNARYNTIVYTDGDRQFDFSEVTKFIEKIKEFDIVIGYRIKRQDSFLRKVFGKGWSLTLLVFFGLGFKDVDCGFKMVRKEVLEKIPHLKSQRGAMINAELVIKAKKYGFKAGEVGVMHFPRLAGRPTGASIRVIIESYIDLIKLWWNLKTQKQLFLLLLAVLALAAFLRFYRLSEYMTFLGDEGRDAIVVKDILVNHHFPLIGPPTSIGNIYLGPLYYYLMAIPMTVFWLNPVAPVAMNAFFGVMAAVLIYYLGKTWFNKAAGLIAAYLYVISPVTITYSRSSWNPNPAPFFALLAIIGMHKAHKSGNYKWLILTGLSAAAVIQMHYLALILLPILLFIWTRELFFRLSYYKGRFFWRGTILASIAFLVLMSPLAIFDLRHNFLNYRAISELLLNNQTAVNASFLDTLARIIPIYNHDLVGRYLTAENPILMPLVSLLILIPLIWAAYLFYRKQPINYGIWILIIWLLGGILGLSLYKQNIYDHYLGFVSPAPFILLGSLVFFTTGSRILKKLIYIGILLLLVILTIVNLQRNPLLHGPNKQLQRTQEVAKFIINETRGEDFNFALLAKNNYDSAYRFYLDLYGHKLKDVPLEITNQLFVVCEDFPCQPINNPKYEIAGFGWAKAVSEQNFSGVRVFKLIPNPSGKP